MTAKPEYRDRQIADYVRGCLDEESTRLLETEMLEDDALFARVQAEELLRRGLATAEIVDAQPRLPWLGNWLHPALTGALTLVVLVLGGYSYIVTQQVEQLRAPMAGVPVITLNEQRAVFPATPAGDDFTALSGPVLMEIDVSAYEHEAFLLRIGTTAGLTYPISVETDQRGYLTVYLAEVEEIASVSVFSDPGGEPIRTIKMR